MHRPWKHIHADRRFQRIPERLQRFAVARERCRVAGDIYDPVGSHGGNGLQCVGAAAFARRIKDHNVGRCACFKQLRRRLCRVRAEELGVFDPAALRVFFCVFDRLRNDLHTDDALCLVRHGKADRARAAV